MGELDGWGDRGTGDAWGDGDGLLNWVVMVVRGYPRPSSSIT